MTLLKIDRQKKNRYQMYLMTKLAIRDRGALRMGAVTLTGSNGKFSVLSSEQTLMTLHSSTDNAAAIDNDMDEDSGDEQNEQQTVLYLRSLARMTLPTNHTFHNDGLSDHVFQTAMYLDLANGHQSEPTAMHPMYATFADAPLRRMHARERIFIGVQGINDMNGEYDFTGREIAEYTVTQIPFLTGDQFVGLDEFRAMEGLQIGMLIAHQLPGSQFTFTRNVLSANGIDLDESLIARCLPSAICMNDRCVAEGVVIPYRAAYDDDGTSFLSDSIVDVHDPRYQAVHGSEADVIAYCCYDSSGNIGLRRKDGGPDDDFVWRAYNYIAVDSGQIADGTFVQGQDTWAKFWQFLLNSDVDLIVVVTSQFCSAFATSSNMLQHTIGGHSFEISEGNTSVAVIVIDVALTNNQNYLSPDYDSLDAHILDESIFDVGTAAAGDVSIGAGRPFIVPFAMRIGKRNGAAAVIASKVGFSPQWKELFAPPDVVMKDIHLNVSRSFNIFRISYTFTAGALDLFATAEPNNKMQLVWTVTTMSWGTDVMTNPIADNPISWAIWDANNPNTTWQVPLSELTEKMPHRDAAQNIPSLGEFASVGDSQGQVAVAGRILAHFGVYPSNTYIDEVDAQTNDPPRFLNGHNVIILILAPENSPFTTSFQDKYKFDDAHIDLFLHSALCLQGTCIIDGLLLPYRKGLFEPVPSAFDDSLYDRMIDVTSPVYRAPTDAQTEAELHQDGSGGAALRWRDGSAFAWSTFMEVALADEHEEAEDDTFKSNAWHALKTLLADANINYVLVIGGLDNRSRAVTATLMHIMGNSSLEHDDGDRTLGAVVKVNHNADWIHWGEIGGDTLLYPLIVAYRPDGSVRAIANRNAFESNAHDMIVSTFFNDVFFYNATTSTPVALNIARSFDLIKLPATMPQSQLSEIQPAYHDNDVSVEVMNDLSGVYLDMRWRFTTVGADHLTDIVYPYDSLSWNISHEDYSSFWDFQPFEKNRELPTRVTNVEFQYHTFSESYTTTESDLSGCIVGAYRILEHRTPPQSKPTQSPNFLQGRKVTWVVARPPENSGHTQFIVGAVSAEAQAVALERIDKFLHSAIAIDDKCVLDAVLVPIRVGIDEDAESKYVTWSDMFHDAIDTDLPRYAPIDNPDTIAYLYKTDDGAGLRRPNGDDFVWKSFTDVRLDPGADDSFKLDATALFMQMLRSTGIDVILYVGADWCPPCTPAEAALKNALGNVLFNPDDTPDETTIALVKIDTWINRDWWQSSQVDSHTAIPRTHRLDASGDIIASVVGWLPQEYKTTLLVPSTGSKRVIRNVPSTFEVYELHATRTSAEYLRDLVMGSN